MPHALSILAGAGLLFVGCAPSAAPKARDEAQQLRQVFADFQRAFESRKADRMWPLLDGEAQAAAERLAEANRTAYAKESAAERAQRQEKLGLTAAEIVGLNGPGYLNARPFRSKYKDVPEYKVAKHSVNGDKASIDLLADDGDKDTFDLVRAGETWKLALAIPAE